MESFSIKISESFANYINRLMYEINSKVFIIDRMFEKHKYDTDASFLNSETFLSIHKEYEDLSYEYDYLKILISNMVDNYIRLHDIKITNPFWEIKDFVNDLNIRVTER